MKLAQLILALAAAGTAPLLAQAPQPPVFRAGTDLVEVDVIARDKAGAFVSDLTVDDFELQEDGKPYPVQQVYLRLAQPGGWGDTLRGSASTPARTSASAAPAAGRRVFVIVFDDTHLSPAGFKRTQTAALTLFQSQLHDGDVGGVVSNGRMANGRLTSDRAELIKAVKDAKPNAKILSVQMDERMWPRLSEVEAVRIFVNDDKEMMDMATRRGCEEQKSACEGPAGDDPVRSMLHGKASQFSSNIRLEATRTLAMLRSVLTGLARLEGPKNVLLMSEGFISEETWPDVQDAVGAAARANTRIYTLDARGLAKGLTSIEAVAPTEAISRLYEQMDMGADSINSLAVDTGGFVVRNMNQFDQAIARIADDAGNYYVLGYLPPSPNDGKFHRIRVNVKRSGINLRSRRGYTAAVRTPAVTTASAATASPTPSTGADTTSTAERSASGGVSGTVGIGSDPVPPAVPVEAIGATEVPGAPADLAAPVVVSSAAGGSAAERSTVRMRPDASKHIDLLLSNPSADRAATAGWEAYQRGDVATARASLRVAAASPGAEAWVHYALGLSEYALGDYSSAIGEWETVHEAAPTFEPVYFDLVDGYLQVKQHDKAIRLLRQGAASWPKDPDIFNALGVVQTARGTLPDAIVSFKEAIAARPEEAVSYFNLGRAFELQYFRTRRFYVKTQRWIVNEKDRAAAMEHYERYLTFGGPYADAAREGITRLKWAATAQ